MTDSLKNSIIEFLDEGDLSFASVVDQTKDKILVVDGKGKRRSIQLKRVTVVHSSASVDDVNEFSLKINEKLIQTIEDIDIELLWETFNSNEKELSVSEIAGEYFSDPTPVQVSAMARKLLCNRIYFKQRGMLFKPMNPEQVEERRRRELREKEDARLKAVFLEWAAELLSENKKTGYIPDDISGHIDSLEYYLYGTPNKAAESLLKELDPKMEPPALAFKLLVQLGRVGHEEDFSLIRAGVKEKFSEEVLKEAAGITHFSSTEGREDYSNIFTFAIDDAGTEEIDDAFSIKVKNGKTRVTVHIADGAEFIDKGSLIDVEARNRSTTLYLPDRKVTMMPPCISCDAASLKPGELRPVMSFILDFDERNVLTASKTVRAVIRLDKHIDYSEADKLVKNSEDSPGNELRILISLAEKLRDVRLSRGAVTIERPELKIKVESGNSTVKLIPHRSGSRTAVGEFMILVNSLAAEFAVKNQIDAIFRTQNPPETDVTEMIPESGTPFDPIKTDELMRCMKPAQLSICPEPHFSMGLNAYIQLTSPLRRYSDLVMQRQFKAHLSGVEPPYDKQDLLRVLANSETTEKEMKMIEGERNRYWVIKYFETKCLDRDFEAVVIRSRAGGYTVELSEYAYRVFLRTGEEINTGEKIKVKIAEADGENNRLSFSPV